MGLWNAIKKRFSPPQEPEAIEVPPSADVLWREIADAIFDRTFFVPTRALVVIAPMQEAQREAILQKMDKLDKGMYLELEERCWYFIAQQVRADYEESRAEARARMKRGASFDRKAQQAVVWQILSRLSDKHSQQGGYKLLGLQINQMCGRFFALPETDNLRDNLILTRAMLRHFLPQYLTEKVTEYQCEIYFLSLLTEQARGLTPEDLFGDNEFTHVIKDTTGMGEKETEVYQHFYDVTKSYVRRWNTQEWSYFLDAWSPLG